MADKLPEPNEYEDLMAAYRVAQPEYEAFVDNVGTLLLSLLRSKEIEHLPIEKRTKTIESFRNKLMRPEKEEKYRNLSDMTDLAGIRIVAYYEKDVERICEIIQSNFSVDVTNSADKTGTIDADRFGYLSKHFIVSHGERRRDLPENIQFSKMKTEIQVRTVVQHAWAVIDRRLRYNNEADIPRELRRRLFRISALLELADKEFSEVDTAITELRAKYEKGVRSGHLQIEINRDSVEVFLAQSRTVADVRKIAQKAGILNMHAEESITRLIQTISFAGFKSIEEVDELLRTEQNLKARLAHYFVSRTKARQIKVRMSDAFLVRLSIFLTLPKAKAEEVLEKSPFVSDDAEKSLREAMKV